jgi:Fe/S biogenesis protein NfuA
MSPQNWIITANAVDFIKNTIKHQAPGTQLVIQVEQGGTYQAQLALRFEHAKNLKETTYYKHILTEELSFYTLQDNLAFLKDLQIDFKETLLGGELEINAPSLYGVKESLSLLDEIQIFFAQEILPYLKQHKGHASFERITQEHDLVLKFEGGCQGCSMAKVTLKQGIEQRIKERFPMIRQVIDETDHTQGDNPYA